MAGGGKALKHGEKVLTPSGFKNIEDMVVGETVITPDNTIEYVTGVYPQGKVAIYRVTFQDGVSIDTCGKHLWEYHVSGKSKQKVSTTLELKEIVDSQKNLPQGATKRLPIIPLCVPVDLRNNPQTLPIAPYSLGAILGDGHIQEHGGTTLTSMDSAISERIRAEGYIVSGGHPKEGNKAKAYGLVNLRSTLRELGLAGKKSDEKFIPQQYIQASIEDRFALVQGLMDTDGYVSKDSKVYFDTTSPYLAEGIRTVLLSLGYTVTTTDKIGSYRDTEGVKIICKKVYRLYIRGGDCSKLFHLKRKVERCKQKKIGRRIESIEFVGFDYATCISISGSKKLFLTTNFVVTHNSFSCLVKNLDGLNDPHFRCTIFRRTRPELTRQGGLADESQAIYRDFGGDFKKQSLRWDFPSGAQISFAAISSDADLGGWQGSQLTRILIDEAADKWTESQVLFLLSRLRSAHSKINTQMILTANPDISSFLKKWVDYSLDPDTGVPVQGTEKRIRWFVVISNVVYWADSPEECYELHGKDRGMVYARGMTEREMKKYDPSVLFIPKSFRFIPTGVMDNPYLLPPRNSSYLANLLSQSRVNQLKYLHGSWSAKAEGDGYFKREWVTMIDEIPRDKKITWVRSYDLAATEESEVNRDPDYTAGVLMGRDTMGMYYIADVYRFRKNTNQVMEAIIRTSRTDGLDVVVTLPKDTGAGGKASHVFFSRYLAEHGISVKGVQMSGFSSKLNRFLPFASLAEGGSVCVLKADWNDEYFTELENFVPLKRNQHDDMLDATSDAFNILSKESSIPTFQIPNLTGRSIAQRLT